MAESGVLEKLATNLSLEERQRMLEKLRALSTLSAESLYPSAADSSREPSLEEQYTMLPWYYRLYFFFISMFRGKAPQQIFLNSRIAGLGRRIAVEYPQFYDFQKGRLLPEFYRVFSTLKEDSRFFFDVLDVSVNRDRGSFFAFLGSLEMEEVHRKLEAETEPEKLWAKNPDLPEGELRQAAMRVMEDAFAMITETQRTVMYRHARSLHCFKELASFLYDRVLLAFSGGENQTCSINVVKDMLASFNSILFSLKDPPSLALLESLFVFSLQEKAGRANFDHNRELHRLLGQAEKALGNIKNFNRRLSLTSILKCAYRDMAYKPRQISGGEDWYAIYRDYWKRYIDARFSAYLKNQRRRKLWESCRNFFHGGEPLILEHAAAEEGDGGFPLAPFLSLSFLLSFYKLVYMPDIHGWLIPIVFDGEFLKKENRTELTGAYNDLAILGEDIQLLDERIGPEGIYGDRYTQARQEMSSLPVKRRKVQLVLDDAAGEGREIIDRTRSAIDSVINILGGILKKDSGGRYDSLSNLSQMEARIPNLDMTLRGAGERLRKALGMLDLAAMLETESERNQ
ncbi:MAG: DUF5312 domain-containing protein [Treponema sp.]|jgi:hypothetical protein|nr:DUF5312 domain-containing protein [Treponema sp.]